MAMTKVKNLQLWCKKMAEGYRDVDVRDMAASWKSGLAFCAIIHRFRPDLIDYDSLSKENVFENNHLAFEVAEKQLNIPAFLEAADMVAIRVPDKLSVVTYVSQYYNYFHDKPQLGGPGVKKCTTPTKKKDSGTPDSKSLTPSQNNTGNQAIQKNRQESIGDKCMLCQEKVYLLERHIENGKLYHRSCFRKSELSPTNKVFKRQPFSATEEDKGASSATKLRKIEDKKEVGKQAGPEPDFWQRRAEAKAKKSANDSDVLKKSEVNSKPDKGTNVPSWKKDKDSKMDSSASKTGVSRLDHDKKSDSGFANKPLLNISNTSSEQEYLSKKPTKAGDLINKFKELDERNLKANSSTSQTIDLTAKESNKQSLIDPSKSDFPKPKPRQNFTTHEGMDTSETPSFISQPKPTPRGQKLKEDSTVKADHFKSAMKSESTDRPKSEFPRPKTPPHPHKSNFQLNISDVSQNKSDLKSPSSPPPLPSSTPPKLPLSEPPKLSGANRSPRPSPRFAQKASPVLSPRNKNARSDVKGGVNSKINVPFKAERSNSPMDTTELPGPSKAIVHEPSDFKAVLVVPKRSKDEKQNREVLGGLLKSLANVRTKHDSDSSSTALSNMNVSKQESGTSKVDQSAPKTDTPKIKVPPRPKSSFVSQSSQLFGDKNNVNDSKAKGIVTTTKKTSITTTVVTKPTDDNSKPKTSSTNITNNNQANDDDIPEWKRLLEKRKQDRARPKSADLLSDKGDNNNDNGGKLDWQKEAEKRKQARQGGYVDPEKNSQSVSNDKNKFNRPLSPYQRKSEDIMDKYVNPANKATDKSKSPERSKPSADKGKGVGISNDKKKIGLGQKFVFEEPTDVTVPPPKPPRRPDAPPNKSPTSPKSFVPNRPPPPKTENLMSRTRHHITPQKIQQELKYIDSKLTQLELKGRTLEDSIRKASEVEEDDLMISWFQLVNEKNELVRTECDFIYLSRQQELEIEQEEIDRKLRTLLDKPEDQKTEGDIQEEDQLTDRLLDVVNQRNKIVDSIDEDRLRYLEEDKDIEMMLQQKGFLKDSKDREAKVKKDTTKYK